jgi:large subunit ribosomal protein L6
VSRVGNKPIIIPKGVSVTKLENVVKVKGPKGELKTEVHNNMKVEIRDGELTVQRPDDLKVNKSLHGLTRALIQNMVKGVTEPYQKTLDIVGVGYKAEQKGENLLLNIGYSHPIYFIPPSGITVQVSSPTQIIISGIDKQLVGMVSAKIRAFKEPEPYKGKGIKYSDEQITRKAGKTAGK